MATLSKIMEKAASSVIPLANRITHTNYPSAIFTTPLKISTINTNTNLFREVFRTTSIPTYHHFSAIANKKSNSDDTLLSAIESEIDRAEGEFHDPEVAMTPREFPFKIEDNAGEKTITLTRKYQGEEIKVAVRRPDPYIDSDESDDDEREEKESEVEMDVCVTKISATTLKFKIKVDADWVTINSLAVKNQYASDEDIAYKGPGFLNLDLLVRESFRTYLEDRGIEPSSSKFLHDYLVNKEHKEYTAWLKNLKNFIAN